MQDNANQSSNDGVDNIYSEEKEMVDLLVSLGFDFNTAMTLICLHTHGPSKSIDLQKRCSLRQPDVSVAIGKLREFGIVNIIRTGSSGRGRPSQIYELSVPLSEALIPFRKEVSDKLATIQSHLKRLTELSKSASN